MLEEGSQLPKLSLPDENGDTRTLRDLSGDRGVVLYIYPKDNTPGCTVEATDFRDRLEEFEAHGYHIAGLSRDSAASHCNFIEKEDLNFPLLTDADAEYLKQIGAYGEKKNYGKVYEGILRSTLIVDIDGTVRKVFYNVKAKGHAERMLREVSGLEL